MITLSVTTWSSSPDTLNSNSMLDIKAWYKKMKQISPWLAQKIHSQVYPIKIFSFYYLYTNLCYISVSVIVSDEDLGYYDFLHHITHRLFLLSYVSRKKLHLPNPSLSFTMTLWQCTAIRTSCHKAIVSANWMVICTVTTLCHRPLLSEQ